MMFHRRKDISDVVNVSQSALIFILPMIQAHLMGLSDEDRYKRFFSPISEAAINKYLSGITVSSSGDAVFVVYNSTGSKIVGFCHAAVSGIGETRSAEVSLTVSDTHRNKHIGIHMLERAVLHCKTLGIKRMFMHCLTTNKPMQEMAKKLGMRVIVDFSESTGQLEIAQGRIPAVVAEAVTADHLALYDLSCRQVINAVCSMLVACTTPPLLRNSINKDI
jgi:RimJ/RimL family protein N-acetyltransferase